MHRRATLALCYALLFVPLAILPWNIYPFATGKAVALRLLGAAGLILWALRPTIPRHPIALGALLVLVAGFLSMLVAPQPDLAFWSSPPRQEGLANGFAFAILFLVLTQAEMDWRRYIATAVGVASFIAVVGIAYHLWYISTQVTPPPKVHSLAGNSAYLGLYLAMTILMTIWLWIGARYRDLDLMVYPWPMPMISARPWLSAALVAQVWCLTLTRNRGAVLALGVGLLVWFVLSRRLEIARMDRWKHVRVAFRLRYTLMALAALCLLAIFTLPWNNATLDYRLELWEIAVRLALQRPILGYGGDGFFQGFIGLVSPNSVLVDLPFDRAHNFVLDRLVAGGAVGLTAYLYLLWAMFRTGVDPMPKAILACLVTGNLFLFDVMETSILFWVLAAYLVRRDVAQDAVVVPDGQPALDRGVRAGRA